MEFKTTARTTDLLGSGYKKTTATTTDLLDSGYKKTTARTTDLLGSGYKKTTGEEFTLHGPFVLLMHLAFTGYHNIAENVTTMEEDNNNTYIRAYQYLTN